MIDESKLAKKTALETAINEAKTLEKGNHTDTAWNALQEAIADAQAVYDTLEASQTEVDNPLPNPRTRQSPCSRTAVKLPSWTKTTWKTACTRFTAR